MPTARKGFWGPKIKVMYKVRLRKPYGKIYNEATFDQEWFAKEFVDAIKGKLYDVVEIHKNEKVIYSSQKRVLNNHDINLRNKKEII